MLTYIKPVESWSVMFENLVLSFQIVSPLFILIGLGQLLHKMNFFSLSTLNQINDAAFTIFLPAHLFISIYQSDLETVVNIRVMMFVIISLFLLFFFSIIITPLFEKDNRKKGVIIQGIIRSNFVIMGFPIMAAIYSPAETALCALILAVSMPIYSPMQVIALEMYRHSKANIPSIMLNIAKNPLILATLAGIFFLILDIPLAPLIEKSVSDIGRLGTPLALIVLGGTLKFDSLKDNAFSLTIVILLKLLIIPMIAIAVAVWLGFNQIEVTALMIFFAAPTAVTTYAMALKLDGDAPLAQQIVILTTLLSMISLVMWITVVKTIFT